MISPYFSISRERFLQTFEVVEVSFLLNYFLEKNKKKHFDCVKCCRKLVFALTFLSVNFK